MDWIPIDLGNPLILLRVYLAALWGVTGLYGLWVTLSLPRTSAYWPLGLYSIFAALTGALSYFLGAASTFRSIQGFIWVAGLLTFTPISIFLWLNVAKAVDRERL